MKIATSGPTSIGRKAFSKNAKLLMLAVMPIGAILWAHPSLGANLTWDSSGTANSTTPITPVDGDGAWDTVSSLWFDGTSDVMWPNDSTVAVFGSGGTAGTVTLSSPITTGGLTFNNTAGDYTIAGGGNSLTLTGAPAITVAGGQSPTINAPLAGTAGFAMNGPGTLNLTADNSALSGAILINSGTLAVAAGSNLGASSNSVILGTNAANTPGTLTLAPSATVTIGSFAASTSGTSANVLTIGAGAILNVTSNSALSGLNQTANAAFLIGTPNIAGAVTTVATVNGGGTLNVNGGTNNSSFLVGVGNCNTSTNTGTATLDLSGLTNFTFSTGTGTIPAAGGNEFAVGHGAGSMATLSLATNNTITAGTITVADNSLTPGLTGTNPAPNAPSNPSTLNLGSGTNIFNANAINIGSGRSQGIVQWGNTTVTGTLTIAGAAGGTSTANITIGNLVFGTPPSSASNLNLKSHSVNVQAGTVIIGELSGSTGGKAATTAGGSVTFDTGTFTAVNIKMAFNASGTSVDNLTGTFNMGSSANSTGVLNVTGSFWIADNINTAATPLANGVFAIKGGTANIGANILDVSTTGTSTTTLALTGGTLNMQGFAIGPVIANPNDGTKNTRHITTVTLPTATATIANLGGTGINDAGVNMNSTGTLILTGTNTYTGGTIITSGTLQVGASTDVSAPSAPFTTGATAITDSATLAFGSSQTLVMSGAINGTGGILQNGNGTTILAVNNGYAGSTTISKGTLQIGNGGATGTVSSASVANNGTLAFNRNDAVLTFGNTITGTGSISQIGSGTVLLTASNTYTGGSTVSNGTLKLGNATALGFGGQALHTPAGTTVNASGTLDLNGLSVTQPVTLSGGTLTNSNAAAATVTNGILAVNVLTSVGPFTGDSAINYSGGGGSGATVNAILGLTTGSFVVSNGGSGYTGNTVAVTITGGGGIGATGTATVTGGVITAINITNPGTGYTTAPSITIAPPTAGTTALADGNANNFALVGTQQITAGSGYTSAPIATLTATSGTATFSTPLISGISLTLATTSFIGGAGNITVAGPVTGGGSLTKNTSNTITLLAPNTYTGNTNVNAGTLLVNGSHTGGADYNVANGATLGGTGSIGSNVNVAAGGILSPGASINNLTVASASLAGILKIEANDADPNVIDVLNVTSGFTLNAATLNLVVTGSLAAPVYVFAHYGTLTGNPFASIVGLPAGYSIDYNYQSLNEIALVLAAAGPANLTWDNSAPATGNGIHWDTAGQQNWSNGGTPALFNMGDNVTFNDANNNHYAVALLGTNVPGSVTVSANGNYTFSGLGTISGTTGLLKSGNGTLTITNANDYTGGTSVTGGTLLIANVTAIGTAGNATLAVHTGGTVKLQSGLASAVKLASLTLDGSTGNWAGKVDITNNKLIIEDSATHSTSLANLKNQAAFAAANANSAGLFATGQLLGKTVIVLDNGQEGLGSFGGVTVDANSILAMSTFPGDANLDGQVTIADLNIVVAKWQQAAIGWTHGDFNGDNQVTIADLNIVASNWQKGVGAGGETFAEALASIPGFGGNGGGSTGAVPEPASLVLLGIGGILLATRQRK